MAWNHPSEPVKPAKKKNAPPSMLKGIAAGLLIIAALAGVLFFVLSGDKPAQSNNPTIKKSNNKIKPVTLAPAPKARKIEHPKTVDEAMANLGEPAKPGINYRPITPDELDRITNRVFKTGTEQLMSWVFTTEPGNFPVAIPPISDEDKRDIAAILISKNEASESDDEHTRLCKEQVALAKKEMAKYLADGGNPDEFLQYYHQQLMNAFEYRNDASRQVEEIIAEGDLDLARDFVSAVNRKLDEQGIKQFGPHEFAALEKKDDNDTENTTEEGDPANE